jgi:CheY-like chemotaxis protein
MELLEDLTSSRKPLDILCLEGVLSRRFCQMLAQVRAETPELILLDLMMPEMNGFEFIEELRKSESGFGIPIIVVTAKDLTPEERALLNGHVQDVLQKGAYSAEKLLFDVRSLLKSAV